MSRVPHIAPETAPGNRMASVRHPFGHGGGTC